MSNQSNHQPAETASNNNILEATVVPVDHDSQEVRTLTVENFGGVNSITNAGVTVTPETAMKLTAVSSCVKVIAEGVAMLPLILYRRLPGGGKERATDHPLYELLHDEPNEETTSFSFRECMTGFIATRGNAFAEIERDRAGRPIALWQICPTRVKVDRHQGKVIYVIDDKDIIPAKNMLHIPGFGGNGVLGISPIAAHAQSIGLAIAAEKYGSSFFGNNASPGGVLETDGRLSDEAYTNIKRSWEASHRGPNNAHRVAILEDGVHWTKIGIDNNAAQFIETRKFQKADIASIFRVPLHMINSMEQATLNNMEEQGQNFVTYTLTPWLIRWEQEIKRKLFTREERKEYFVEFLVDGLLRGKFAERMAGYATGRNWGIYSADDIREKENMNPLPDGQGKMYLVPANMFDARKVQAQTEDIISNPGTSGDLDDESNADDEVRETHRALFESLATRMITKETNALKRAIKNQESYIEKRDKFYESHADHFREVFTDAAVAYVSTLGNSALTGITPDIITKIANDYVERSLEELNTTDDVAELLEDWQSNKAKAIADIIILIDQFNNGE